MSGVVKFGAARFSKPSYSQRGWVYFARGGDTIKVGFAIYPTVRFLAAARELECPVTVLACVRGDRRLERELLEWFQPWRKTNREWFDASPDLLAFAATLGGIHVGERFAPFIHLHREAL